MCGLQIVKKPQTALELYDKAIQTAFSLSEGSENDVDFLLTTLYSNKAAVLSNNKDQKNGLIWVEKAIETDKKLISKGLMEIERFLANDYMNKGSMCALLGKTDEAEICYLASLEIWNKLVRIEGQSEFIHQYANILKKIAVFKKTFADSLKAIEYYRQATEYYYYLVMEKRFMKFIILMALLNE